VFKKEELLRNVWGLPLAGPHKDAGLPCVTVAAQAQPLARDRLHILNVWGVGYRLVATAG
jgi:DNA-binding response OmpR family regulator